MSKSDSPSRHNIKPWYHVDSEEHLLSLDPIPRYIQKDYNIKTTTV